jgi:adenylate cyclase
VRKRHPGTGVVILSQYDDPEYAVALLAEGSAGYGYLLKDHIAEGNQLIEAIRMVATGGTALDPSIVEALVRPVTSSGELSEPEEALLALVAEGKPIKAIARREDCRPKQSTPRSRPCSSSSPRKSARVIRARCIDCACCTSDRRPRRAG